MPLSLTVLLAGKQVSVPRKYSTWCSHTVAAAATTIIITVTITTNTSTYDFAQFSAITPS